MAQKLIRKLEAGTGGIQHMDRYYHSNPKGLWDEIMFDVTAKVSKFIRKIVYGNAINNVDLFISVFIGGLFTECVTIL